MNAPPGDAPRLIRLDAGTCRLVDLEPAVRWLRRGGIVLYPTDTFYGLAVDPTSSAAVEALFDLKHRDPRLAVPLIAASRADLERVTGPLTGRSAELADAFWPGPLSIVLDAPGAIDPRVHGGRDTIAVRVPAGGIARLLAQAHGGIITATSANRSGEPPATRVEDVPELGRDARVLAIDAGPTPGGAPSTIVDARGATLVLVRAGAVPWERVLESR